LSDTAAVVIAASATPLQPLLLLRAEGDDCERGSAEKESNV
jgi:hypothetical protein